MIAAHAWWLTGDAGGGAGGGGGWIYWQTGGNTNTNTDWVKHHTLHHHFKSHITTWSFDEGKYYL